MLEKTRTSEWFFPTTHSVWGDEERAAIDRVLSSGRLTQGEEVAAFEREFAEHQDQRHAIMVNSGSSANLVMIAALTHLSDRPLQRGDAATVPALAWSTTYAPLVQHGLDLTLADCDDTWNASLSGLPPRPIRPGVVVGCSILGNPAWSELWAAAAATAGAYYVEDNCESIGAVSSQGNRCGTLGLMNSYSLFWSHQLGAIEGGVITTDSDECDRLCRMLRAHGWTRDVTSSWSFEDEYDFRLMGYNVRSTEIHAAVAREQLRKLPEMIRKREKNSHYFRTQAVFSELPIRLPVLLGQQSPFGLHFEVADSETRLRLVSALRAAGIDCRLPTGGSFRRHAYGAPWAVTQQTPRADQIHDRGLFLGNGPLDLTEQIDRAIRVMKEVL